MGKIGRGGDMIAVTMDASIVKVFLTDKGALRLGLRIRRGYERGSSTYGAWGN